MLLRGLLNVINIFYLLELFLSAAMGERRDKGAGIGEKT